MNTEIAPIVLNGQDVRALSEFLGVREDVLILPESEFSYQIGCPPEAFGNWLETDWVQHDIRAVLDGTDKVVRQLWPIRSERDGMVRLFSPSDRLALADAAQQIALSAEDEVPGQEPLSAVEVLAWRDHVEKARRLCLDACRACRAHDWHEATLLSLQIPHVWCLAQGAAPRFGTAPWRLCWITRQVSVAEANLDPTAPFWT